MTFVASTITEHIRHEVELIERGRSEERIKRAEAEVKRAKAEKKRTEAMEKRAVLTNLEELFEEGLITE